MIKKLMILLSLSLLLLPASFAQGRRGRQAQGQSQGTMPSGSGQMERKRIHATSQQRDQIRSCDRLADGIRKQARKMAQSSGNNFNPDEAIRQQSQIRDQIRSMEQEHERLVNSLDATQQQAWQERIRNMSQSRDRLNLQQQQMETALKGSPSTKSISEHAREMERTVNNWRAEYSALSTEMEF
jgi:hypothetical protein